MEKYLDIENHIVHNNRILQEIKITNLFQSWFFIANNIYIHFTAVNCVNIVYYNFFTIDKYKTNNENILLFCK